MCGNSEKPELNEFSLLWELLINATVILDKAYQEIECVGCDAELLGNTVTLKGRIHGFTSAVFRVRKSSDCAILAR